MPPQAAPLVAPIVEPIVEPVAAGKRGADGPWLRTLNLEPPCQG
jgi:hypothetical protein